MSLQLNALKVYQKLIDFHIKKDHKNALALLDIQRLNFINLHAIFNKKEKILESTLHASKEQNKNHEASGLYAFEIAKVYKEQSKNKHDKQTSKKQHSKQKHNKHNKHKNTLNRKCRI